MESSRRAAAQLIWVMVSLVVAGVVVVGVEIPDGLYVIIITSEQQEILHLQHQVKGIVVDIVRQGVTAMLAVEAVAPVVLALTPHMLPTLAVPVALVQRPQYPDHQLLMPEVVVVVAAVIMVMVNMLRKVHVVVVAVAVTVVRLSKLEIAN